MKIAFCDILHEPKNGEHETILRLQYVLLKQSHELLLIDKNGWILNQRKLFRKHIEEKDIDFVFTCDGMDFSLIAIPNVFNVFMHWAPLGFFENFKALLYLKSFSMYDHLVYSCEPEIFTRDCHMPIQNMAFIGPSVPVDFVIRPRLQQSRKLFYVGINFERALANMRYGELLKNLDNTGSLEIYGPKKVYGRANLWAGFQSYRGEIPFDGHTIMEKINQAGVCLALNSPMHNDANAVTSRTYEAAAAGAVIISDDNEFVHKYFGDSVFYIEKNLSEKEASEKILNILRWVNTNPQEAYDMACRSQQVFIQCLTLDKMVSNFVESTERAIAKIHDRTLQIDVIDVICFIDEIDDYLRIESQLKHQYYQNLHLILIASAEIYKKLQVEFSHDFVLADKKFKGRSFLLAKKYLKGKYFMFIDRHSILHARHIFKNYQVISGRQELFVYSGCYLKTSRKKRYVTLNSKPISRDEFLLFIAQKEDTGDLYEKRCHFIKMIFTRSAALFDKNILNYARDEALGYISDAVHYYLACCSLVNAEILGRFTNTLTTGYCGNSVKEVEKTVFQQIQKKGVHESSFEKNFIEEMNHIFSDYCLEYNVNIAFKRNFEGEYSWSQEAAEAKHSKLFNMTKRFIPRKIKNFIKSRIK